MPQPKRACAPLQRRLAPNQSPPAPRLHRLAPQYDASADASLVRWEVAFPSTTPASDVTLPPNTRVVVSGCALGGSLSVANITIPASSALIVADQAITIRVNRIVVDGSLVIGTSACPLQSSVTFIVPGGNAALGIDVSPSGSLDVHGTVRGPTWTRLAASVPASAAGAPVRSFSVRDPVAWRAGDRVVLTSTYWKDEDVNQNEVSSGGRRGVVEFQAVARCHRDQVIRRALCGSPLAAAVPRACAPGSSAGLALRPCRAAPRAQVLTVTSVTNGGTTVNVNETILFPHYGVEYPAEVGLLTRNILFTSDAASTATGLGPHTTSMSPNVRVSGAAWERWGARNVAGRYRCGAGAQGGGRGGGPRGGGKPPWQRR